ncbi:hypothetical protein [Streptomyces sp. NPDC097610]|uniref:hypothetical protein n=1 Tax=Streptomyces sp. NPDC097610 TaxID=3157227 RepID=UPI00332125F6
MTSWRPLRTNDEDNVMESSSHWMLGGTSTSLRRDGARRAGRAARARSNELATAPKELYSVPDAGHVDLYDKTGLIQTTGPRPKCRVGFGLGPVPPGGMRR